MRSLNLVDETFDEHFTDTYHLAIECDLKGFSYSILDTRVNKCVLLKHYDISNFSEEIALEKIESIIEENEHFVKNFKSATFIYKGSKNVLIPNAFFSINNAKHFFEFQNTLGEYDELHVSAIDNLSSTLVFAIPTRIAIVLTRKISSIKFVHENVIVLNNILESNDDSNMLISFNTDAVTVFAANNNKLTFFNTFNFNTPLDAVFYIMGAAVQLGMDTGSMKLSAMGHFEKDSELSKTLKNSFKNIHFIKGGSEIEYSYKFREVDQHIFVNLFNSFSCVS